MIVKHFNLKNSFDKKIFLYLIYGQNFGLIDEIINDILKPQLPNNIFNYNENEILSDPDKFEESLFNKSFFDNEKLIIINRSTDKILNLVRNMVEKGLSDTSIIIKSGNLEKKSKLRNFFEKSKEAFCIPVYEDNHQTLNLI